MIARQSAVVKGFLKKALMKTTDRDHKCLFFMGLIEIDEVLGKLVVEVIMIINVFSEVRLDCIEKGISAVKQPYKFQLLDFV